MRPEDELFLGRALQLARRALPAEVEPNPPVGAVIAVGTEVLGEGYHRRYGGPHAEIEALAAVRDKERLPEATLYVTLEPCCHTHKKTPPCVPAIVEAGIRRVVVGTIDPNPAVRGAGIAALRAAGLSVELAPNPRPFRKLLRHFWVNLRHNRPYITLKWAQTAGPSGGFPFAGGWMGSRRIGKWPISGFWGQVWAHRLRAQHSHIAVGYRTWLLDKPALTTRLFPGGSPQPLVFYTPAYPFPNEEPLPAYAWPLTYLTEESLSMLYHAHRVGSLLVEGGAATLNRFLAAGLYDEVHIIVSYAEQPLPPEPVWAPAWPALRWRRKRLSATEEVWFARKK